MRQHTQLVQTGITPRKMFDAVNALKERGEKVSQKTVMKELGVKPGFAAVFATCTDDCSRITSAYWLAKNGCSYKNELDDTDFRPEINNYRYRY